MQQEDGTNPLGGGVWASRGEICGQTPDDTHIVLPTQHGRMLRKEEVVAVPDRLADLPLKNPTRVLVGRQLQ
jgi:hypothetical protein